MSIFSEVRGAFQVVGHTVCSMLEALELREFERRIGFDDDRPVDGADQLADIEAETEAWEPRCDFFRDSSAAPGVAADPSPTETSTAPGAVGGEGRKEDSGILPPASFRHPIVDETGGPR